MAYVAVVIGICSFYLGFVIHMATRQIVDVLREVRNAIKYTAHPGGNPGSKYVWHENVAELAQQRDQLLAALELLLCDVEEAEYMTGLERETEARAVIQKVRGGEC